MVSEVSNKNANRKKFCKKFCKKVFSLKAAYSLKKNSSYISNVFFQFALEKRGNFFSQLTNRQNKAQNAPQISAK